MMLLLDSGNSRLKLALLSTGGLENLGSMDYAALRDEGWFDRVAGDPGRIRRVAVASVAGPARDRELAAALARTGMPDPEFAKVEARACGVSCAYPEPERMGVDRWVALLGARALGTRPVCVADAGSALTVDALDAQGAHLGGMIAPGLAMMRASLLSGTGNLEAFSSGSRDFTGPLFAADTRPAIEMGAREAAAGLVERALCAVAEHTGASPDLLITGGDGKALSDALGGGSAPRWTPTPRSVRIEPDLAFLGLARLVLSTSGDILPDGPLLPTVAPPSD